MRDYVQRYPRAVRLVLGVVLAVLGLAGCSRDQRHSAIDSRFIGDEPAELFTATDALDLVETFEWDLTDAAEQTRWVNKRGPVPRPGRKGLRLDLSKQAGAELRRETDLEAEATDALTFRIEGLGRGNVMLRWANRDQSFEKESRISLGSSASDNGRYRFEVGSHPGWTGTIARLAIRISSNSDPTATLVAITGRQLVANPDKLSRAVSRPWRVTLADETRSAMLAPPGLPHEWEVEVPKKAELALALGVTLPISPPVGFRITAALPGGEAAELLDEMLMSPDPLRARAWHERRIPLDQFAGQRVRLRFETTSEGAWPLSKGMPVWASPEILAPRRGPAPVNVVVISVDTLRADRMSAYGYSRDTSPQISRLAQAGGIVFESVVVSAPWTLPSHTSMFTGLDALSHGVNFGEAAPGRLDMLAERFQREDYRTVAFPAGAYLNPKFGLAQGFDLYSVRHQPTLKAETDDELQLGLEQFQDWLGQEEPRPFFAFFHSYEVHSPYRIRQPYFRDFGGDPSRVPDGMISTDNAEAEDGFFGRKEFVWSKGGRHDDNPRLEAKDLDLVSTLYDSGVAYMDSQLGPFLEFLKTSGLSENTIVVLTSDHGEALGEHGSAAHGYLWDDNLMVPLILWLPGDEHGGSRIPTQVRSIDLVPTLLDYAGLPMPEGIDGMSLRPLVEGKTSEGPPPAWSLAASMGRGVSVRVSNRLKYLLRNLAWAPIYGRERLYDLRADSGEQRNLAPDHSSTADLRALAKEELEQRLPGLRVRLVNEGERTLEGRLGGPRIARNSVSSFDLECPCVHYKKSGTLEFEVPPGGSYTLILSRMVAGDLHLELERSGDGPGAQRSIVVESLEQPFVLTRREGGWAESSGEAGGTAQITVWWPEGRLQTDEPKVHIDPELEAQLRALGYL